MGRTQSRFRDSGESVKAVGKRKQDASKKVEGDPCEGDACEGKEGEASEPEERVAPFRFLWL